MIGSLALIPWISCDQSARTAIETSSGVDYYLGPPNGLAEIWRQAYGWRYLAPISEVMP